MPEDDKYPFSSVVALNVTYCANFDAELAVVSMLPMFFQETWGLTAVAAGQIAASFAFVNLFARPIGGLVSDRFGNRRFVMMSYMLGIAIGFVMMGLLDSNWPLIIAIAITIICSFFVQGAEGAAFGIVPSIKWRVTGQIGLHLIRLVARAQGEVLRFETVLPHLREAYAKAAWVQAVARFTSELVARAWVQGVRLQTA